MTDNVALGVRLKESGLVLVNLYRGQEKLPPKIQGNLNGYKNCKKAAKHNVKKRGCSVLCK